MAGHYNIALAPYGCGFKQKYDLPCPTCGMTTSVYKFARGEIFGYNGSFYVQPAVALLCTVLVVLALLTFIIAVFGVYFGFIDRLLKEVKIRHIILALVIIVAAGWAVTLARALGSLDDVKKEGVFIAVSGIRLKWPTIKRGIGCKKYKKGHVFGVLQ